METLAGAIRTRAFRQSLFWWTLPLAVIGGWHHPILGFLLAFCIEVCLQKAFGFKTN